MSKTLNLIAFDLFSVEKDATVLRAFSTDKNILSYKRTAPKRVKDFPGMEKTELKHTLLGVDGSIIGIQTVTTSIRADTAMADRSSLNAISVAAMADPAYEQLFQDQRLPIVV